MKKLEQGSITTPAGFRAAGVVSGIKESGTKDLALIASDTPASAAAVYTRNRVQAAPIAIDRDHLTDGRAQAVILNSGNANACTGTQGEADARRMCEVTATTLGLSPRDVLVCSTGVIGVEMPMQVIEAGIGPLVEALSPEGGISCAEAMMTTDTVAKHIAVEVEIGGRPVKVGGVAKGAAMISPNMATMLAVVGTDAGLPAAQLHELLFKAVGRSFNCVTVDGDMSTNDTVIAMANGAAGVGDLDTPLSADDAETLYAAMEFVCRHLARAMAADGEGASKLIHISVRGGRDEAEAKQVGLSVANSSLVKTAVFGNDPNWGRILCAMGYAGVDIEPSDVKVTLCGTTIYTDGAGAAYDAAELSSAMQADQITIDIDLAMGGATAEIFTCDLTYEYVRLNAEYTT
ncbi:MAG: bifunctional glutamate N-acetyltransferase/amino-acid acetyltransferase ArgJ [Gemmatimonadetes bacterium]|jgi:glutamate N-acetyltransferase / amino-acid N-acetyltransferase|nr:bifunctional glutamate N-acetyltransferase/amino-acid acetyltransferase ArgJ [Gemmatimonadota bacterium]